MAVPYEQSHVWAVPVSVSSYTLAARDQETDEERKILISHCSNWWITRLVHWEPGTVVFMAEVVGVCMWSTTVKQKAIQQEKLEQQSEYILDLHDANHDANGPSSLPFCNTSYLSVSWNDALRSDVYTLSC